jgi:peptidoglycan/xylan/chitin deacetylase (PgdA/CDA1 family)
MPGTRTVVTAICVVVASVVVGCGTGTTPTTFPPSTSTPPTGGPSSATPTTAPTPGNVTASLPPWLAGPVVTRLPTSRKVVALTFDCGAGAAGAKSILVTLTEEQVPATFFVTGDFAASYPDIVAAITAGGFLVGNHTMSHPHLNQLSSPAVREQIIDGAVAVTHAIGTTTRPWFRFPFGEYEARTLEVVHQLGYGAIGWTVDSRGWQGRAAGTAADIPGRVLNALRPGAIVLMHVGAHPTDGTTYDADALAGLISAVRARGYDFVTLSQS